MLVLTRNINESIIIGSGENKIVITVLNMRGKQAKIGINAPREVTVHREEVYIRMQEEEDVQ